MDRIAKAKVQAVEEFKVSFEMKDLNVKFSQEAFIKGFKLCKGRIANKFLELNLSFLVEGVLDEEVGPPAAATNLPPIELAIKEPGPTDAISNFLTALSEV